MARSTITPVYTETVSALIRAIGQLEDEGELQALQEALTGRHRQLQAQKLGTFALGDRVWFTVERGRNKGMWFGTITGFKGTSAEIQTDSPRSMKWTVAAVFLKRHVLTK
jgi:hypothetical protein